MLNIRNIRSDSEEVIEETITFLSENPSLGVRLRPENTLREAIDSGFAVEVRRNGKMVGCSFVYQFDALSTVYGEIGTMLVTAEGYGLQSFLACFHMLQLYTQDFSLANSSVFAVVTPGTKSESNLRDRVSMIEWSPPETLKQLRADTGVPFKEDKSALHADLGTLRKAQESLKSWHEGENIFRTPKPGEIISIDIGGFTPEMLDINLE